MAADPKSPDSLEDSTHSASGAPTDEAHRAAGDGTLQGSLPAGGLAGDETQEQESAQPGTG